LQERRGIQPDPELKTWVWSLLPRTLLQCYRCISACKHSFRILLLTRLLFSESRKVDEHLVNHKASLHLGFYDVAKQHGSVYFTVRLVMVSPRSGLPCLRVVARKPKRSSHARGAMLAASVAGWAARLSQHGCIYQTISLNGNQLARHSIIEPFGEWLQSTRLGRLNKQNHLLAAASSAAGFQMTFSYVN
jgi:hypothetical protein